MCTECLNLKLRLQNLLHIISIQTQITAIEKHWIYVWSQMAFGNCVRQMDSNDYSQNTQMMSLYTNGATHTMEGLRSWTLDLFVQSNHLFHWLVTPERTSALTNQGLCADNGWRKCPEKWMNEDVILLCLCFAWMKVLWNAN